MAEHLRGREGDETGSAPMAPSETSSWPRIDRIKQALAAALLVLAPSLSSCVVEGQENDSTSDEQGIESVEQVEGMGKVQLQFDSVNWYVEGEYPKDFDLKVYADGKLVHEETVTAGEFYVHNPVGFDAKKIKIEAFKADGSGEQIKIDSPPGPEGMEGLPVAYNTLKH